MHEPEEETDPARRALAAHLKVNALEIDEESGRYTCQIERGEWRVLSESEAEIAFKEAIESFVDECVLSEIPEAYRSYFDLEKFTRDVEMSDGRGGTLAPYDGEEHEAQIDGAWFFIYRTN